MDTLPCLENHEAHKSSETKEECEAHLQKGGVSG